jgi:tight adherence protein B
MFSSLIHSKDFFLLLLAGMVFLSFFFFIQACLGFLADPERRQRQKLRKRLRMIDGLDAYFSAGTLLKEASLKKSFLERHLHKFRLLEHLKTLLLQADLTWKLKTFLITTSVCGLGGLTLGLAKWGVWGGVAGALLGVFIPYRVLASKRKRRLQKFEKQLPEALDLLARGLRAGHTFPAGLQQVAKEMPPPLGKEFHKTFKEFSHGLDLNSALMGLCQRIELRDLSFFTTAVLIQRETGGNLTEILEKISILIRERFKLRNQVKALTAEGRMSGIILILLPPVLAAILMGINPEYESQLFFNPVGQVMCGAALGFQLLGMLLIYKIVNIKV